MTEPTQPEPAPGPVGAGAPDPARRPSPPRRRPRPAANSRWIATGLALCGTFGMVGGMAYAAQAGQAEAAPSASVELPPLQVAPAQGPKAKDAPPDQVVVIRRPVPTEAAPVAQTAPAPVTSSGGS